jgi:hypothetical protein
MWDLKKIIKQSDPRFNMSLRDNETKRDSRQVRYEIIYNPSNYVTSFVLDGL